jgi:2-phosphoglycerate kinase
MIYLIGGTGRSGKSTVRKLLCQKYQISGISTDQITQMMAIAVPEYNLNFESKWQIGFEKMNELIKALLTHHPDSQDFVIEGWQISPKLVKIYQEYSRNNLRICILGCSNAGIKQKMLDIRNNPSYNEWTDKYSDKELENLVKELIETSKRHKKECAEFGVQYFETSKNFEKMIQKAADYLINS